MSSDRVGHGCELCDTPCVPWFVYLAALLMLVPLSFDRSLSLHDVSRPTLVDHSLYLMDSTLSSIKRPIVGLLTQ